MPKIAVISDVHANIEAFSAVLKEIDRLGIGEVYALGDMIGYGPNPVECVELARQRCRIQVEGNHEYSIRYPDAFVNNPVAEEAMAWTRAVLRERGLLEQATEFPHYHQEGACVYLHGSVQDVLADYVMETDADGYSAFDEIQEVIRLKFDSFRICFVGHNHRPFLATTEGFLHPHDENREFFLGEERLYASVGSVGQPRDGDARACFVEFDGETLRYHRVAYPCETTARKILEQGLPEILGRRLMMGR